MLHGSLLSGAVDRRRVCRPASRQCGSILSSLSLSCASSPSPSRVRRCERLLDMLNPYGQRSLILPAQWRATTVRFRHSLAPVLCPSSSSCSVPLLSVSSTLAVSCPESVSLSSVCHSTLVHMPRTHYQRLACLWPCHQNLTQRLDVLRAVRRERSPGLFLSLAFASFWFFTQPVLHGLPRASRSV